MRAVARYTTSPREVHWKTAVGISEYVFFTSDFGITLQRGSGLELVAYADADYASKATDRKSVSGEAAMCAGACVCWFSRTRKCVTLSTTEAEYVALAHTPSRRRFCCGTCGVLFSLVSVLHASRLLRTTRGQGNWIISRCARRIRNTSTLGTTSCES